MSLNEPRRKQPNDHVRLLIDRLHGSHRQSGNYPDLCDRASIPRDLRAGLLRKLLSENFVTTDGLDTITITKKGTALATSPLPESSPAKPRPRPTRGHWG